MCGSTKAPQVVKQDPVADQKAADAKATQTANAETALRRRQAAQNSLLTLGAAGTDVLKKTPYTLLGSIQPGTRQPFTGIGPGRRPRTLDPRTGDLLGSVNG